MSKRHKWKYKNPGMFSLHATCEKCGLQWKYHKRASKQPTLGKYTYDIVVLDRDGAWTKKKLPPCTESLL